MPVPINVVNTENDNDDIHSIATQSGNETTDATGQLLPEEVLAQIRTGPVRLHPLTNVSALGGIWGFPWNTEALEELLKTTYAVANRRTFIDLLITVFDGGEPRGYEGGMAAGNFGIYRVVYYARGGVVEKITYRPTMCVLSTPTPRCPALTLVEGNDPLDPTVVTVALSFGAHPTAPVATFRVTDGSGLQQPNPRLSNIIRDLAMVAGWGDWGQLCIDLVAHIVRSELLVNASIAGDMLRGGHLHDVAC